MSRPAFLRAARGAALAAIVATTAGLALSSCAVRMGRLEHRPRTLSPVHSDSTAGRERHSASLGFWDPMFADTAIGLVPGTADTTRRFLGRLRHGYTVDTLNIMLLGDNRPGWHSTRLVNDYKKIAAMFSLNPVRIVTGLVHIPIALFKGLWPDLGLLRDVWDKKRHMPTWGPEAKVVEAILAKVDSIEAKGGKVAAVINTGDLVLDGRYPAHWERFLKIAAPLYGRVPYFPVAGNHERTDHPVGLGNWQTATGLPIASDRLYYCFDSADGWVRFLALDSNPMANPAGLWTREAQTLYSDEQINWMAARLKEHPGPAFVFLHHPPFSVGFHRVEWEADSLLILRRERMIRAMYDARIAVMATGHEHAYERALFEWPDAVLIYLVTGGGGSPLHPIPPPPQSARMFSEYRVAGAEVKPDNVYTAAATHFVHVRLWFGGGEILAYAVDPKGRSSLIDRVQIDLLRLGTPQIDQQKMVVPKTMPVTTPQEDEVKKDQPAAADSVAAAQRLLRRPPPTQRQVIRDSVAATRKLEADSLEILRKVKSDSLGKIRKAPARKAPARKPSAVPQPPAPPDTARNVPSSPIRRR